MQSDDKAIRGLLPAVLKYRKGRTYISFRRFEPEDLARPLIDLDLQRRAIVKTVPLDEAVAEHAKSNPLTVAGHIFHSARCGSTLAANMLRRIEQCVVLSEPEALCTLFTRPAEDQDRITADIRNLVTLYRHSLAGLGRQLIFKWTSWTSLHLPVVMQACPGEGVCFMYREPLDSLISVKLNTPHWVDGGRGQISMIAPHRLGRNNPPAGVRSTALECYAEAVERIYETVANLKQGVTLIKYSSLPESIIEVMAPVFGLEVSAADRNRMLDETRFHSHGPAGEIPFRVNSGRRRRLANKAIHDQANRVSNAMRVMEEVHGSGSPQ